VRSKDLRSRDVNAKSSCRIEISQLRLDKNPRIFITKVKTLCLRQHSHHENGVPSTSVGMKKGCCGVCGSMSERSAYNHIIVFSPNEDGVPSILLRFSRDEKGVVKEKPKLHQPAQEAHTRRKELIRYSGK